MNNEQYTTRTQRHNEQQGKQKNQKNLFLLFRVLFVLLVISGGYLIFSIKHQETLAKERFSADTKKLLSKIQEDHEQKGLTEKKSITGNDNLKVVVYTPKKNQVPIKDINNLLHNVTEKNKKQVKKDEMAVLVSQVSTQSLTAELDTYQVISDHYKWNTEKQTFVKKKRMKAAPIYISHETGKPVTVKDIISSEAELLGVQQVIQQKILHEAKDKEAMIDKVLTMPRISFDSKISYSPEHLTIELPKNDTGVSKIALDYQDITADINTALVDPAALKDAPSPLAKGKKYIALTFDDGPNPATTPQVLDILKEKNVKATFFMLGKNAAANPKIVQRVHTEGHEIANHSFTHPQLTTLSATDVQSEITKTDKAIFKAAGILPQNVRPPYGAVDSKVAATIGKPVIQWDVDSEDWKSKNAALMTNKVLSETYEGSIILMHDIHPETVAALPGIIDGLQKEGFELVTVDALLSSKQKPLHQYFGMTDERVIQ